MGATIFFGIIFVGWLMWSSKDAKETFLFYSWVSLIVMNILGFLYEVFFGPIT